MARNGLLLQCLARDAVHGRILIPGMLGTLQLRPQPLDLFAYRSQRFGMLAVFACARRLDFMNALVRLVLKLCGQALDYAL